MPGYLLDTGATLKCPHGGQVSITSTSRSPPVRVSGRPVATTVDTFEISGCPFAVGAKLQPCVRVEWTTAATRVTGESPILLEDSQGQCLSAEGISGGPVVVVSTQHRVRGT